MNTITAVMYLCLIVFAIGCFMFTRGAVIARGWVRVWLGIMALVFGALFADAVCLIFFGFGLLK